LGLSSIDLKPRPFALALTEHKEYKNMKPKNTICLWFDKDALEAARFYAATFPDSKVTAVHNAPGDYPSGKEISRPEVSVNTTRRKLHDSARLQVLVGSQYYEAFGHRPYVALLLSNQTADRCLAGHLQTVG
jgi:hypothetical protein